MADETLDFSKEKIRGEKIIESSNYLEQSEVATWALTWVLT